MKKWTSKWYILLPLALTLLVIGAYILSFWPQVPVNFYYGDIDQEAFVSGQTYIDISREPMDEVPEYERALANFQIPILNELHRSPEEDYANISGEVNLLTKTFRTGAMEASYQKEAGEIVPVETDGGSSQEHLKPILNAAYQEAKNNQAQLRQSNFSILLQSALPILIVIAGTLTIRHAREINVFALSLRIKDVEPSDLAIYSTRVGGIVYILLGIFLVFYAMRLY